jgi:predicted HicB family RNase H-like nuclease
MKQLGRPVEFSADRVTKALRVPPELDRRLKIAAAERGVSVNVLINAALNDYLQRLVPVEQLLQAQ